MGKSMMNTRLCCALLVSTLCSGFQHGYQTGIMNNLEKMFKIWINKLMSEGRPKPPAESEIRRMWSTAISLFSLGGAIGGMLIAVFADRCGYRGSLMWNNLLVVLGAVFLGVSERAKSIALFFIGRVIIGINSGLSSGLCQMFIVDIAPVGIRGCTCGLYQLSITVGILMAQLSSYGMSQVQHWPIMFILPLVLSLIQLITLPFIPESPKFLLIIKEDETEAEESLMWFKKSGNVRADLDLIKEEDNIVKELRAMDFKRMFRDPTLRTPLIVCIVLMVGQQFCGINAVGVYSSTVHFRRAGFSDKVAELLTVFTGVANVGITIFSLPLLDSWGRRAMLLMGFAGLSVTTIALTVTSVITESHHFMKYLNVILVFVFFGFFAPGIGPIPWFITAELFVHTAKALAVSIAVTFNWLSNYLIGQTFDELQEHVGYYALIIFATLDIFFFTFTYLYLPETAKRTAKEIIEIYK